MWTLEEAVRKEFDRSNLEELKHLWDEIKADEDKAYTFSILVLEELLRTWTWAQRYLKNPKEPGALEDELAWLCKLCSHGMADAPASFRDAVRTCQETWGFQLIELKHKEPKGGY